MPVGLYSDGVQYNDSLGPHTESNEMLYYFFPLLNDPLALENIHLASIIKTVDVKNFGNGKCFAPLVEQFHNLGSVGMEFTIKGETKTFRFILAILTGDNLALNSILGFSKSFSANHYCRCCTKSKDEMKLLCTEDTSALRTKENYLEDLQLNSFRDTGLVENSIFNQ